MLFFTSLHFIIVIILHGFEEKLILLSILCYLAILLSLYFSNLKGAITPYLLLICSNFYTFLTNINSDEIAFILFFIYPIYIAILYHSILPRVVIFIITLLEIYFLIYFQRPAYDLNLTFYDLSIFIFLLLIIISTSIINTLFEKRYWSNLSIQNQSMRKELNSREGYLQLFFDNAKDSIAVFDMNNKVMEVNPAFEQLYGWKREEIVGQNVLHFPIQMKEIVKLRLKEICEGVSYNLLETQQIKKDGSIFDAELTLSPIYNHDGELIASSVISRDVSYKKEAEKLLLQSEKLKMAGEMGAGVAHEERNPMTAISGFIQLMSGDPKSPYYSYTKIIEKEIERINYIISEFLILAKPHLAMAKKYHLKTTIDDILMLFQSELNIKGIVYSNEWLAGDACIFGEETQMKQVLTNILKNAIESISQNGKIGITSTITQDDFVMIKIADNGVGMDEETLQNIFSPFFTTKEKGTGLGMMISEKIITEHGGKILIESGMETGTVVTIQLPLTLEEGR